MGVLSSVSSVIGMLMAPIRIDKTHSLELNEDHESFQETQDIETPEL